MFNTLAYGRGDAWAAHDAGVGAVDLHGKMIVPFLTGGVFVHLLVAICMIIHYFSADFVLLRFPICHFGNV